MHSSVTGIVCAGLGLLGFVAVGGPASAAEAPSVKLALSFRPVQGDVEYETPSASDHSQCRVKVERKGRASGWVVFGPGGQVLRRFVDTNGDNVVDQWRYYQHGLEVYRDIDGNFNNKVDQCRWLNTAGSRWGVDTDEDGTIDEWKVLSAAEATREAVQALIAGDAGRLSAVLLNKSDARTLGLDSAVAGKLLEAVAAPERQLREARSQGKSLSGKSQWMRFDAGTPCTVPAEDGKASGDLTVYQNAMAIVETGGKPSLVQIGEMVRVGEVWKLTQIPRPLEGDTQVTAAGVLMQPPALAASSSPVVGGLSPEMQKLLTELQKLDRSAPAPAAGRNALARYNASRADILEKLVEAASSDEERRQWMRQLVDGLAAAVQSGAYPAGLPRLTSIEAEVKRSGDAELLPYTVYRRMLAEYTVNLQKADDEQRAKVQEQWLKDLEEFAREYPQSEDAPEALLQLAISHEFAGNVEKARKWYETIVAGHADSTAGERAAGAVRRFDLEGTELRLVGDGLSGGRIAAADYRGKVLLVIFWATWCQPCTEELPEIRELYEKYSGPGFAVLGVNLDVAAEPVEPYIRRHGVPWAHIREEGGLESPVAKRFGIISLPTMFLVDKDGKVLSRSITLEALKKRLPDLLR